MRLTSEYLYIEVRLTDWANWIQRNKEGGVGWPRVSLIAIMLEVGAMIKGSLKGLTFNDDRSEEVDRLMRRLAREKPHYEAVIRSYYIRSKDKRIDELSQELKISRKTFFNYLNEGKAWLQEKISEVE